MESGLSNTHNRQHCRNYEVKVPEEMHLGCQIIASGYLRQNSAFDRADDITSEEVKRHAKFSNLSDKQIEDLINSIKTYAQIILACSRFGP